MRQKYDHLPMRDVEIKQEHIRMMLSVANTRLTRLRPLTLLVILIMQRASSNMTDSITGIPKHDRAWN